MKKKIIAILIAVALVGVGLSQVIPAMADAPGPLDRVQIVPATSTLAPGAIQQFTAQGYDSSNAAVPNVNYFWMVTAGGGTISTAGLFTAGSVLNTYTNTVQVVAVQGNLVKLANATVTVTGTFGALDRVVVTPASATLAPGGTKQFSAQGYDASNVAIPGLGYTWSVVAGGGTISATGLFAADTATGTFANTIKASATLNTITKFGTAAVTVATNGAPSPKLDNKKLVGLFSGYVANIGFGNFLGGQWQVKNGAGTDTIKAIPGLVREVTGTSLTVLQNGQTTPSTFVLSSGVTILPKGTQLAVNDKVVVITVNDQVKLVMEISTPGTSESSPPGLRKHDDDKREGKDTPLGWSHGKKTGWNKGSSDHEDENEGDSD